MEDIGVEVYFGSEYGLIADLVDINKERFALEPEEVDVLHGVLSPLTESEMASLLDLPLKRIKRHIRRLLLALQAETLEEVRKNAAKF